MQIQEITVSGYRSIRNISLPLRQVNVLVGPNGCGKSNLYQAMVLLSTAARGELARTLADEGGMPSVLWAGQQKYKGDPKRVKLGVRLGSFDFKLEAGLPIPDETHADYLVELGLPVVEPKLTEFVNDPVVKAEYIGTGKSRTRNTMLLDRKVSTVTVRNRDGAPVLYPGTLDSSESSLSQIRDPHTFQEITVLAREMADWRFYHHFRTDADSPLRRPQVGTRTPVLTSDGSDLAAALQTILENGDARALCEGLESAMPGTRLRINAENSRFSVGLETSGLLRQLEARELSDGTLRYLCLLAALLSPRPPALLALNEPETSLHPDLLEPLAKLMATASKRSQLWVTTHSRTLADALSRHCGQKPIELEKVNGETRIVGAGLLGLRDDDSD